MATTQKHTAGPWRVDSIGGESRYILSPSGYVVAHIDKLLAYKYAHDANARLIAAAPALLAAAAAYLEQTQAIHGDDACDSRVTEALRVAIANATDASK